MARDGHVGFLCMVPIIEAEATDDGSLLDRDGRKKLAYCHCLLRDGAVENGPCNDICHNLFLFHRCDAKVEIGLGVYLPQVDLAIVLGYEADEMSPI